MGSQKDRKRLENGKEKDDHPFSIRFLSFCDSIIFISFLGFQLRFFFFWIILELLGFIRRFGSGFSALDVPIYRILQKKEIYSGI